MKAVVVNLQASAHAGGRLPYALLRAGFDVKAVSHPRAYATATRYVQECWRFAPGESFEALGALLLRAADEWRPEILIPVDDFATWCLHDLWRKHVSDPRFERLVSLIELSVGEPRHYQSVERRSLLPQIAAVAGAPTPEQIIVASNAQALAFGQTFGPKLFLKADYTGGGAGVVACAGEQALNEALKKPLGKSWWNGREPIRCLQRSAPGVSVCVSLVALRGQTLAAFAFVQVHSFPPLQGPASVIKVLDAPQLIEAAGRLTQACGYSGFAAIDFILDEDGSFVALDFNARASQTSHLGPLAGADLCRALHARLRGEDPGLVVADKRSEEPIALFPMEWLRDPQSELLGGAGHDVPWHDPQLVRSFIEKGLSFLERAEKQRLF